MKGTGTSLGGAMDKSPERRKREARRRKAQERAWARKSGPVTVRHVDPATLRPPSS